LKKLRNSKQILLIILSFDAKNDNIFQCIKDPDEKSNSNNNNSNNNNNNNNKSISLNENIIHMTWDELANWQSNGLLLNKLLINKNIKTNDSNNNSNNNTNKNSNDSNNDDNNAELCNDSFELFIDDVDAFELIANQPCDARKFIANVLFQMHNNNDISDTNEKNSCDDFVSLKNLKKKFNQTNHLNERKVSKQKNFIYLFF
jgi:hypothetical protein